MCWKSFIHSELSQSWMDFLLKNWNQEEAACFGASSSDFSSSTLETLNPEEVIQPIALSAFQPSMLRFPLRAWAWESGPGIDQAGLFHHRDSPHCSAATGRTKGERSWEFKRRVYLIHRAPIPPGRTQRQAALLRPRLGSSHLLVFAW